MGVVEQAVIDGLRAVADGAEKALLEIVDEFCPGPHEPKQYRDGNPPWCGKCERTVRGVHIDDLPKR